MQWDGRCVEERSPRCTPRGDVERDIAAHCLCKLLRNPNSRGARAAAPVCASTDGAFVRMAVCFRGLAGLRAYRERLREP